MPLQTMLKSDRKENGIMPYKPNIDKMLNRILSGDGKTEAEEFLRLQANQQLKNTEKKVYQMTDLEKELYAEMNRDEIARYERRYIKDIENDENENGFFSPVASIVLDEFFTDGKH